jgi:hypothetical protein
MERGAYGRNVMQAVGEGVDQPVIPAAACDLARIALSVDLDLEDHAGIILEMTPEIGFEYDGRRSGKSFQPVEECPRILQGIPNVYV